MTNQWHHILTADELTSSYALTAKLDPAFAAQARAFYDSRSAAQLDVLAAQAWNGNNPTSYQLARSHRALLEN